jgi:hypothetical protein
MKSSHRQIRVLTLIVLVAATVAACGGGGSDATTSATANAALASNPLVSLQGTFAIPCSSYQTATGNKVGSGQGTITVDAAAGRSEANVSIRYLAYDGVADCATTALSEDITATGTLTKKDATKLYTLTTGNKVTADVVTFKYSGVTFSKGTFTGTLPMPGVTTDLAYVLDGNNLRVAKGGRDADGLGDSLSAQIAVRK